MWKQFPLRIPGPTLAFCCQAPTILVQSMKGGFVTQNCSKCGRSLTLKEADFRRLQLWVACPKCNQRMVEAIIPRAGGNYGYLCQACDLGIKLAELLPQWFDVTPRKDSTSIVESPSSIEKKQSVPIQPALKPEISTPSGQTPNLQISKIEPRAFTQKDATELRSMYCGDKGIEKWRDYARWLLKVGLSKQFAFSLALDEVGRLRCVVCKQPLTMDTADFISPSGNWTRKPCCSGCRERQVLASAYIASRSYSMGDDASQDDDDDDDDE